MRRVQVVEGARPFRVRLPVTTMYLLAVGLLPTVQLGLVV